MSKPGTASLGLLYLQDALASGDQDEIAELLSEQGSVRKLCVHLGITSGDTRNRVSDLLREHGIISTQDAIPRTGNTAVTRDDVTFENLNQVADDAIEQLWNATQAVFDAGQAVSIEQDEVDVTIDTDLPIGVVPVADLHIGAPGVDPKRVRGLIRSLSGVDGLHVAWNADLIEGAVMGNPDSMKMAQAVRVKWQRLMVKDLVSRVPNSIAVTCGQHEFFGHRAADFDFAEEVAAGLGVPYLGTGGTIRLQVGETPYTIGLWHKYRGQSIYDATAGAKKLCAEHGPFDCTFVADKHAPAVSAEVRHGGLRRVFARGGTASMSCEYAKSLGYTDQTFNFPLCIFWPHERKMWIWDDLREGLAYLKFLRS